MEVVQLLDNFLYKENKEKDLKRRKTSPRKVGRLWPSEASVINGRGKIIGKCARAMYYAYIHPDEMEPMDIRGIRIVRSGKMYEIVEVDNTKRAGILQDNNVKFEFTHPTDDSITISGEVDVIYHDKKEPEDKDLWVGGEIKTGYGYAFTSYVFDKPTCNGMPKIDHILQVLLYLYFYNLSKQSDFTLPKFVMTYIERGEVEKTSHVVEITEDGYPVINGIIMKNLSALEVDHRGPNGSTWLKKSLDYEFNVFDILDRYKYVNDCVKEKKLPSPDFTMMFTEDEIEKRLNAGEVSKTKYTNWKRGKTAAIGDWQCAYCSYRNRCIKDAGGPQNVNPRTKLKTPQQYRILGG